MSNIDGSFIVQSMTRRACFTKSALLSQCKIRGNGVGPLETLSRFVDMTIRRL